MNPHQYFGLYRGFVTDVSDPNRLGRTMIRIPVIAPPDIETGEYPSFGWAWPAMGQGMGEGFYHMPKVGDQVWVQFEAGDPDRPVFWPGSWTMRGGENNAPLHTQGRYDNSDNFARNEQLTGLSAFPPTAPDDIAIWSTPAGKVEMNSTPGNERLVVEHKSGSRVEIMPDGTVYIVASGNVKEVASGTKTSDVSGAERYNHNAPVEHNYKGLTETHVGAVTKTYKDVTESASKATLTYGKLVLKATAAEISYYGQASFKYGAGLAEGIFGDYNGMITETANWAITNALGSPTALTMHMSNPLIGSAEFKVGALATNSLLLRHPVGKIPGLSDVVLKATAILALTSPLITLGATEGVAGKEFTVRGVSLLTWLDSHIHTHPNGPTGPPAILCPPSVLSTSTMVQ